MSVKLDSLIAKVEAAIESEADASKKRKLVMRLATLEETKRLMGDDPDDKGDEDDDGDDSKSAKHKARSEKLAAKAKATGLRSKAAAKKSEAAALEEEAKKCEEEASGGEEDDDEAKKAEEARLASSGLSDAAQAAIREQSRLAADTAARTTKIEASLAAREQSASIKEALADGRITPAEAKMLGGKSPEWCAEYIATREGVRVVSTEDGHLVVPKDADTGNASKAELAEIDARIASLGVTDPKTVEKLRADMITNRRKSANGAAERY